MRLKNLIPCIAACAAALHAAAEPQVMHYDSSHGLSNNYVLSIAQDKRGFVWIATEDGLNRFDGTAFRSFENGELGLAADELSRIVADPTRNVLWICTQRMGLDRLDCDTYTVTHYPDGAEPGQLASNGITDAAPAADGKIWISTYTSGLDCLDPESGEVTHFNTGTVAGWPDNRIWTVVTGPDGRIYLGHVDAGFTIFNPRTHTLEHYSADPADPRSLPGNEVRAIAIDPQGNVWAGTNGGLALLNPVTRDFTVFSHDPADPHSLVSNNIYHLAFSDDGRLWVSTENGGLSTLDLRRTILHSPDQIGFTNYTSTPSDGIFVSNKTVHTTFEDTYGNIWIGTYGDGVDILCRRPRAIAHRHAASHSVPLSDNSVMSLCIDGKTIYAGTDAAGIDIFPPDGTKRTLNAANSPLGDNAVLALMRASDGNIWAGTYKGDVAVIRPDGHVRRFDIPGATDIRCFAEKPDGTILAGAGQGIISISPDGHISPLYLEREDVHEEWVRSLLIRPDGDIWVGSFGYGISIFGPGFTFRKKLSVSTGLKSNTINQMLERPDGKVWAATGNGLALISPTGDVDTLLTAADGLPGKAVKALATDRSGRLWMSTDCGISMLDHNLKISNYSGGHGISNADFYSGSTAADGDTIYFGSHRGLYAFAASTLAECIPAPAPQITGVTVYGRNGSPDRRIYVPDGRLAFEHNDNTLLVRFGVTDASTASAVEWSYNVEGVDNRWYPATPESGILLRDIPPGRYRLAVKASMPNQTESSTTILPFEIKPPIWATIWAKIIYILLAAAAILGVMLFYKKRLALEYALEAERGNSRRENELHAERMRFFTNITHELRTPLTLILGPLEDMKSDRAMTELQHRKVTMIHKSAKRLLELINTILEFRRTETQNRRLKVEHGDIACLIEEIGQRYRELNTNANLLISTTVEPGDYHIWYDPEVVSMIVDNLMSNACKYTPAGSVTLRLSHTSESGVPFTEISVSDTGLGMDSETLSHIFDRYYRDSNTANRLGTGIGLALVYNLVELHRGEIFVESTPGQGALFRFRIHTGDTYPGAERRGTLAAAPPTATAAPEAADTPVAEDTCPIVLIVEDNLDIVDYLRETLSGDYTVHQAVNGAEGLRMAGEILPDIIISDIMMPEMDGLEMIRRLKAADETSHIPVIIITAKNPADARIEAYEAGADSFISKPFSSQLVKSRLRNILDIRHRLAQHHIATPVLTPAAPETEAAVADAQIVSAMTERDAEFMERVEAIINDNISGEKLDVQFIADAMCMSHSTLYRKVKSISGLTVNGLIRKCRARRAEQLLVSGRYTVSEIAFMVGMGSPGNFRQCFKDEFGINPSEYLRKASGES